MLILKRKVGESIVINKNTFITIVKNLVGGGFEVAIEAPKDVAIDRLETHDSKKLNHKKDK